MKKIALFISLAILCTQAQAQQKGRTAAADLHLNYEIIQNDLGGKRIFLSALTVVNKGKSPLPASGWSIYFNFPRLIHGASVSPKVQIDHINGDFYRLRPTNRFAGLKPKDSLRVEYTAGAWGTNITDAPAGIYIVWDNEPSKGYLFTNYIAQPATRPEQFQRYAGDKFEPYTPAKVFEQNAVIKDIPAEALPKVFPTPASYKETGATFNFGNHSYISYEPVNASPILGPVMEYLAQEKAKWLVEAKAAEQNKILFVHDSRLPAEGYRLSITSSSIVIGASTPAGAFYAIQSLKSLMPPDALKAKQQSISIPTVEIIDSPRFAHRAFMLDVARNFQSKKQVLKTLDLMAQYKLNVFHFHFSDDEGWRIEIPGLPELTEVGARRGHAVNDQHHLHPSFGSGPDLNTSGTGFYTRNDFIEILKYAKDRHIKVIPEIETPGHARAAIAAMDARYERLIKSGDRAGAEQYLLYDRADTSKYRSVQRWFRNVMNPALPSTYRFLEKVVDELSLMYREAGAPLETIHFGGDEVPNGVWTGSPSVHELIAKDSMVNNVNDAWYYYFSRLTEMMKQRSMYVYGWEEAGMRKTRLDGRTIYIANPDFAKTGMQVDVWNNVIGWGAEDLPYQLANAGYKVILSPVTNMYFDLAYHKEFNEPGQYWGGFIDVDKPFKFIPFDYFKNSEIDINGNRVNRSFFTNKQRLTDYGKDNIPGLQGLLWAETLRSPQMMEYLLLPKLLGLAERAWAPDPAWATEKDSARSVELYNDAWSQFVNVLGKRELPRLDHLSGGFQYRIPTAGAVIRDGKVEVNSQFPGLVIRYTTDGKEPSMTSAPYTKPLTERALLKIRLFDSKGRGGRTIQVDNRATTATDPAKGKTF
jgi:hexosaminidase